MNKILSPNMLKTFEQCPRKYAFRYVKGISMPVNDSLFILGKNIHALASYYLNKENTDNMLSSLSKQEQLIWDRLKQCQYFKYKCIGTEINLSIKINNYFFGGRLDAILQNNNKYYILDYKTGTAPKNATYDFQTMIYLSAVSKAYNTQDITFVYIDLKNNKEIKIDYNKNLENEYKTKLIDIAEKITNYENYTNKKNDTCNCEYKIICY